jgi:hypothetical protein
LVGLQLFDASGAALSYASYVAFTAAGWSLAFIDMATGTDISPSISATVAAHAGPPGFHFLGWTLTANETYVLITPPTGFTYQNAPSVIYTGESNDLDTLYARVSSVYAAPSSSSPSTVALPSMVEGDSYLATLQVPTTYLTRLGWADLTGVTLVGTVRAQTDIGTGTALADLVTGVPTAAQGKIAINAGDATKIDISWTDYPTGMVLTTPQKTAGSVTVNVSIEATLAGKSLTTIYRATLTIFAEDVP